MRVSMNGLDLSFMQDKPKPQPGPYGLDKALKKNTKKAKKRGKKK